MSEPSAPAPGPHPGRRPRGPLARMEARGRPKRVVRGVYCGLNACLAIAVLAVLALATGQPYLFPSLGPTIFLLFFTPAAPAASPRNTLSGHLLGVLAGWGALAVTGLLDTAPNLEDVDWRRVAAAVIALGLTCGLMPLLGIAHPPAGATTLIVALGLLRRPEELGTIMLAVLVLCLQGVVINRAAGVDSPVWQARRGRDTS